jgi:hypothetical protein
VARRAAAKGVPRSVALCGPSACVHVSDRALRMAVARTEGRPPGPPPRPAPNLRVGVGGRSAADPSAYAAIVGRPVIIPPDAVWRGWSMSIGLTFASPGPWADWDSAGYFPAARLLHIPGAWVRVAPAEAAMIASDAHPSRPSGGRGIAALIAIALAACGALLIAATRRRPGWRPRGA